MFFREIKFPFKNFLIDNLFAYFVILFPGRLRFSFLVRNHSIQRIEQQSPNVFL